MAKKEFKVYKEKPYMNSDKNPFGLTLKGSSKEYRLAHDTIKQAGVEPDMRIVLLGSGSIFVPHQISKYLRQTMNFG